MISIKGLDKADVLATLYNNSRPRGLGVMRFTAGNMPKEEAQGFLDEGHVRFDYLKGRVMKVTIEGDELDPRSYDRDNGDGAAERAIGQLR